jgi:hypothetical protein
LVRSNTTSGAAAKIRRTAASAPNSQALCLQYGNDSALQKTCSEQIESQTCAEQYIRSHLPAGDNVVHHFPTIRLLPPALANLLCSQGAMPRWEMLLLEQALHLTEQCLLYSMLSLFQQSSALLQVLRWAIKSIFLRNRQLIFESKNNSLYSTLQELREPCSIHLQNVERLHQIVIRRHIPAASKRERNALSIESPETLFR